MESDFQARLKAARQTEERAKEMDGGEFPPDPPPGVYEAVLQTCKVFVSSTGKPMCQRVFVIDGGDSHGMQARDFLNLEQDFLIARLRTFVEANGYEWPSELFDYEQSEKDDTWVFTSDMVDTISSIEGDARRYKIDFTQRVVNDRTFNSVAILEVGDETEGGGGSDDDAEPADDETTTDETTEDEETDDDELLRTELLAFCVDEGGVDEVSDDDDLQTVKEKIGEYTFWPEDCDKGELNKLEDLENEDPKDGISADAIELLQRAELGDCVVDVPKPKKKAPAKKKAAKKKGKK